MFNPNHFIRQRRLFVGGALTIYAIVTAMVTLQVANCSPVDHRPLRLADQRVSGGSLVIAGGGRVTPEIRRRFVELAGGDHARIVVIPASDPAPGNEEQWLAPWRNFEIAAIELCNAQDRISADSPEFCAALNRATGVWFSGGYQSLLANRYVGTAVQKCLHAILERNGVVGGCSAGAAILSKVMIEDGEESPREAAGLDLIPNAVVDQHFLKRNRLFRLQQVLESHPALVGFGVDENTAMVVDLANCRLSVVGDSYAVVCLPPSAGHSSRIEILKSGDVVLLSKLLTDHLSYHFPVEDQTVISQKPPVHST